MNEWLTDAHGNRASVAYFGSREAAQAALDSLVDCKDCVNCRHCSACSGCSDCRACSACSGCRDCSDCSDCCGCRDCSACSDCSYCSGCTWLKGENSAAERHGPPLPVPTIENIHGRVLAAASVDFALDMRAWHTCETTHCRAGQVTHMAGAEGRALEEFLDTPIAALMIYRASSPIEVAMTRFFETDEQAMADMKRCAELEAGK